jgi:hypothetical protein
VLLVWIYIVPTVLTALLPKVALPVGGTLAYRAETVTPSLGLVKTWYISHREWNRQQHALQGTR